MIIPDGYAQVNLQYTGVNVPTGAEVTFGVEADGLANATAIGNGVADAVVASTLMANFVNDVVISTIHVKVGPNETGPFADVAVNIPGTTTSPPLPANVSLLVKKSTPLGGRKGAGRMFFPGVPEAAVDDAGNVDGAYLSAVQTDLNALLTQLEAELCPMYLLHGDATTPSQVLALTVLSPAATQRRRLRR